MKPTNKAERVAEKLRKKGLGVLVFGMGWLWGMCGGKDKEKKA